MITEAIKKFRFQLQGRTLVMIDWANVYGWFSYPKSRNYLGWEIDPRRLFEYLTTYEEIFDKRLYHGVEQGNKRSEDFGLEIKNIGFNFIEKEVKWAPVFLNEENHFKIVVKKLFDVLNDVKTTNSDISTKLYELRIELKSWITDREPDFYVDDLIEKLDTELKKLNINIEELQQNLLEPVERRKCDFDVEIARDTFNLSNDFEQLVLFSGDGDYSALVDDLITKGKKVIVVFAKGHKGKEYKIQKGVFLCTVEHLKDELCRKNNIPVDFSTGRDTNNIAGSVAKSNKPVDN